MIFDDVTERKIAEQQRAEPERKALPAEKLESLNLMAGSIAHNFNNQVMGIVMGHRYRKSFITFLD